MKLSKLIYAGMLLLITCRLYAQAENWEYISTHDIVSKDSLTRDGYTLVFINKAPAFDSAVKQRMVQAFFAVYPLQAKIYNTNSLKRVIFIIDPGYIGVAATSGDIVRFNPGWFASHPGDIDVVTHEVMHIVQSYPGNAGPGWLTEGIADYVRYKMGVDNPGADWILPPYSAKQSYTDAYRITARFLVWAEENYNKELVKKLDAALRTKTYHRNLWHKLTGKNLDELWTAYQINPAVELNYR